MEDVSNESLVDEREDVMVSRNGENPTVRKAHFLKPTFGFNSTQDHLLLPPSPPSLLSSSPTFNEHKYRLCHKAYPSEKWKTWVHNLKPKFQEIWKKAGIYEAILASTYKIPRDQNLIMALAHRWCGGTNTFIFPWGEVTVTLEDIINLGCYSVLGVSVSTPLHNQFTGVFNYMKKVQQKARSNRASVTNTWMKYFMCSGKQLEHEAFLAFWLAKFVLLGSNDYISIEHLQVAIHLSQGTKVALAPVILASIYRDMRLLSKSMLESSKLSRINVSHTNLLHMWAWERFPDLSPVPNVIERGEPRSARWNGVTTLVVKDVRAALDSAKKSFLWRPYAIISSNCMFTELYTDNEQWVMIESDEMESFARCLRVSEIVGSDYTEQYHPNRVAMQFGFDQDLPPHVIRSDESPETAWCSYNRPIRDVKLYIPPRLFEAAVSSRYLDWWEGHVPLINEDATTQPLISLSQRRDSVSLAIPSCASKCLEDRPQDNVEEDSLTIAQLLSRSRKSGSYKNRKDADNNVVSALCSETRTKYMFTTEAGELGMLSSEKCEKGKSSNEEQIKAAEHAVVDKLNNTGVNIFNTEEVRRDNSTTEVLELEINTHILKPDEVNTFYTEEERFDKTTSEAPNLELTTRILRLEMIIDIIKSAKFASTSRDIN